jgi:hypothetical protein
LTITEDGAVVSSIYSDVLFQAAAFIGGEEELASRLKVEEVELTSWLLGSKPPVEVVLRALRLIDNAERRQDGPVLSA